MHRVLILEDHRIIATDLAQIVDLIPDCTATVSATAHEALEASTARRYDLALIDIDLGAEEDGISAAVALRAQFGTPSIFVSAYLDGPARERAARAEPLGFLRKPFVVADVIGTVIAQLGNGNRTNTRNAK